MAHVLLAQGDARHMPLKDKSVHMICSSPPFYNLRDYQTGHWIGGNPACDHSPAATLLGRGLASSTLTGGKATTGHQREGYRSTCGHCGAQREDQQLGLEVLHDCAGAFTGENCGSCYVCHLRQVAAECWRVLRDDGIMFWNLGDSYANDAKWGGRTGGKHVQALHGAAIGRLKRSTGLKPKDLCMIPARVALALQSDGWTLRSEIIWHKPSCMPESVRDRPTRAHEQVFLLSKKSQYFYDAEAVREEGITGYSLRSRHTYGRAREADHRDKRGNSHTATPHRDFPETGRNARTVWTIPSEPFSGTHFACFPQELARRCILAGTSAHGVCGTCGSPWARVVERQRLLDGHTPVSGAFCQPTEPFRMPPNGKGHYRYSTRTTEHGWQVGCQCDAPVKPAIVFDPFCGSGTTLLTARALGRHGIGTDLSLSYLRDIARERLGLADLARWNGTSTAAPPDTYTDLPLFTIG